MSALDTINAERIKLSTVRSPLWSCVAAAVSLKLSELVTLALPASSDRVVPVLSITELDTPTPALLPSAMPPDSAVAARSLLALIVTSPLASMLVVAVGPLVVRLWPIDACTSSEKTITANEPCTAEPPVAAAPPMASA